MHFFRLCISNGQRLLPVYARPLITDEIRLLCSGIALAKGGQVQALESSHQHLDEQLICAHAEVASLRADKLDSAADMDVLTCALL